MKKTKILLFGASFLAVCAIVVGLCCFFFANKGITEIPGFVTLERISNDWVLTTEYHDGYDYRFKVEQKINGSFVEVDTFDNKTNTLNLSKQQIDLYGSDLRFSACYVKDNNVGKYSQTLEKSPKLYLDNVDYKSLKYDKENQLLSWKSVLNANSYAVILVDSDGKTTQYENLQQNSFSTENISVGEYRVFVLAKDTTDRFEDSTIGTGWTETLLIERQNIISNVRLDGNALFVTCSENVQLFEVWVSGTLKGYLTFDSFSVQQNKYVIKLTGTKVFFDQSQVGDASIKSCASGHVKESNLYQLI